VQQIYCRGAESGPVEALWERPRHPYTEALFAAMPSLDPDNRTQKPPIAGDPPNPINPPSGCRFHTRCAFAEEVCSAKAPALFPAGPERHVTACHMVDPKSGHSLAGSRGPAYGVVMAEVKPERVATMAAAARVPLPEGSAARIAKAVSPVVARMAQDDIAIGFEIEPATYEMVARRGVKSGEKPCAIRR